MAVFQMGPAYGKASFLNNEACRACRRSPHRNVIWLTHSAWAVAGLGDRIGTLWNVASLAQPLCARVYAGRPCSALVSNHNNGVQMPCNYSWSTFVELQSVSTGQSALTEHRPSLRDATESTSGQAPLVVINGTRHGNGKVGAPAVIEQYERALACVASGERFVWILGTFFWQWVTPLKEHIRNSSRLQRYPASRWQPQSASLFTSPSKYNFHPEHTCNQLRIAPSVTLQKMAGLLEARLGVSLRSLTTIHVRRGDSLNFVTCNMTAEHVAELVRRELYDRREVNSVEVSASSKTVLERGLTTHTTIKAVHDCRVLVFTDEKDPTYLHRLLSSISAPLYGATGRAMDHLSGSAVCLGDQIIRKVLHEAEPLLGAPLASSNYMTYAMGNVASTSARRHLMFGWGSPSCYREECAQSTVRRKGEENICGGRTRKEPSEKAGH